MNLKMASQLNSIKLILISRNKESRDIKSVMETRNKLKAQFSTRINTPIFFERHEEIKPDTKDGNSKEKLKLIIKNNMNFDDSKSEIISSPDKHQEEYKITENLVSSSAIK